MKIVRAMKKVSRLQGEIKEIKHRIQRTVYVLDENEFEADHKVLSEVLHARKCELIQLKSAIMHTNVKNDMFKVILELGELKGHIAFLREIPIKDGLVLADTYGSSDKIRFKSQLSTSAKELAIRKCQERINDLTDTLDDFNAKTDIEEKSVTVLPFP